MVKLSKPPAVALLSIRAETKVAPVVKPLVGAEMSSTVLDKVGDALVFRVGAGMTTRILSM